MNLNDKVAIVTGGAMGIGRAMAEGTERIRAAVTFRQDRIDKGKGDDKLWPFEPRGIMALSRPRQY